MCAEFERDNDELRRAVTRFAHKYDEFSRTEWLGGDRKVGANENPPARCMEAMRLVQAAHKALVDADHEVAMFRATGQ